MSKVKNYGGYVNVDPKQVVNNLAGSYRKAKSDYDEVLIENQTNREYAAYRLMFIVAFAVFILFVGHIAFEAIQDNAKVQSIIDMPRTEVYVHQGDTLEDIAATLDIDGISDTYLADIIADINGIEGNSYLVAGTVIEVPDAIIEE